MKLQLLPKAEWIPSDERSSQGPVYTEKGMGFNIPTKVFLVLFISMFPLFFLLPVIAIFVFGLVCILAGLNNTGRIKSNGKITKNTLWSRTPAIMAGLFIIIIGITTFFELKDDKKGDVVFFGCMKVLIAVIALLLIGRAVFLIVTAAAISARKKRCTEAVLAELTGLTVSPLDPDSGGDEESNFIYIYNYEGNDYRLIVDGFTTGIERTGELELSVDPQQPEFCYYRQMSLYNGKKIKNLIFLIIFLLLFSSPMWGAMLLMKYY